MTRKPVATKIAMLLSAVGPDALERYNNFECQEGEDEAKYNHVKTKLDTELEGQKRIVFSNYPFWDHSKTSGQTFYEFLSQPSLSCEFAELDNMIRDRKVFFTENPALKERLLREPKLDLQKVVHISRSSELAYKEFVSMKGAAKKEEQQVHGLNTNRPNKIQASTGGKHPRSRGRGARNRSRRKSCRRCGTTHARN